MSSHRPVPIAYVVASMHTGGTQTHLLQVLRLLDRERFAPHVFALRDEGDLLSRVAALDVPVATLGMSGGLGSVVDWQGARRLVGELKVLGPGLVHGYLLRGNFFAAVCARMAGVKRVVTSRRGLHEPSGLSEWAAVRVSNALTDLVTGNSPAVLEFTERVEGVKPDRMLMIPSGIDLHRFQVAAEPADREADGPVLAVVMQFKPRKGYPVLLDVISVLAKEFPGLRVRVAGESELAGEAAELARARGVADRIEPCGIVDDMPAFFAEADVFLLPSETEGMSNALLEAMAMEMPVVSTAVGGAPIMIDHGISGYLVEYGDVQGTASVLRTLFNDESLGTEMGRAARERVEQRFSAESMVRQMEDMYEDLIAKGA